MPREFQRGHKARISDLTAGTDLYVGVQIAAPGLTFDISCFGLDADERLSDDRYFVFFNQPRSPEEAIQLLGPQAGDTESFRVTLERIPPHIRKLSFTATIDGAGQMAQIGPGYLRIVAGGQEVARYAFTGSEFSTERAVMLGDIYFKDGWRFAAVGQGFDGGLEALLKNFGGEVLEEEEAAVPPQQPQPGGAPGFAPPAGTDAPPAFAVPPGPAAPAPAPPPRRPRPRSRPRPSLLPSPSPRTPHPRPEHHAATARTPAPSPSVHAAPTIVAPMTPPGGTVPPPGSPAPTDSRAGSRRTVSRAPASRPRRAPAARATRSPPHPRPRPRPRLRAAHAPPGYGQQPPFGQAPGAPQAAAPTAHPRQSRTAPRRARGWAPRCSGSRRRPPGSAGPCRTAS
nr:TerD family protein [Streptomyces mexicanus]